METLRKLVEPFLEQAKTSELVVRGRFPQSYMGLKVLVSFGKGNVAKVPWIAFLTPGQRVSEGIYPILLLYKNEGILVLAYGVSEVNRPTLNWGLVNTPTIESYYKTSGLKMEKYRSSLVHSAYDVNNPIQWEVLSKNLEEVIRLYRVLFPLS